MKKAIVITSIFKPTVAVQAFAKNPDYQLIVVGDKKTPKDWYCKNVDYISVAQQQNLGYQLSKVLPFNHYCRKMLGYLQAIKSGAEYIIDTDDDNIPKPNFAFPELEQSFDCIAENKGFINIYQLFTQQNIWPRGLPLELISKQFQLEDTLSTQPCKIGVWQGLADEDPDVDAVYRLSNDQPCYFNERPPVVLGKGTIAPFNSQNTLIRKELFALMYLPTSVTFRFTDILRGLIAQPIMWLYGYQLGFSHATVIQKRNAHDYMEDFASEIPMYTQSNKAIELVMGAISASDSIESNLYNAYLSLLAAKIVHPQEMLTLDAWLEDMKTVTR
ncbi:protein transglucosylase [uncultured Candidatus Thioglobus sp.]|nr:protein transglucosylase [uncultured Candidatus Thioglobus sp.]